MGIIGDKNCNLPARVPTHVKEGNRVWDLYNFADLYNFLIVKNSNVGDIINVYFSVYPAQDRGPVCIFHIMNENLRTFELINTFIVGNHCPNF